MSAIVIGAGAAGIAAARTLHSAGIKVVVLEAASYVGGRVKTDTEYVNFPVELGAEFIHGDGAITHELLKEAGLSTIPVDRYGNLWWAPPGQTAQLYTQLDPSTRGSIDNLFEDKHAVEHVELEDGRDISLEHYLRSRGRTDAEVAMAGVLLCQTLNARCGELSVADLKHEFTVDTAGDGESRVAQGYHQLLNWLATDLEIHLNTAVDIVTWTRGKVVCHTSLGTTFAAQACIITASVAALQKGAITFQPPLPEDKRTAINAFDMRPSTKLIYVFKKQLWPDEMTYVNHDGAAPRWWTPAFNRPGADPVIMAFITADRATAIDDVSEEEALHVGLKELSMLLGLEYEECQKQLLKARRVSWQHAPYVWGGFSSLPPGAAPQRFVLAAPTADILFWAGEATAHHSNPQTVHGAVESGIRAATECLKALQEQKELQEVQAIQAIQAVQALAAAAHKL